MQAGSASSWVRDLIFIPDQNDVISGFKKKKKMDISGQPDIDPIYRLLTDKNR